MFIAVCDVLFLKINSHVKKKKRIGKQQYITTATLSQTFPSHGVPAAKALTCWCKVRRHHCEQSLPALAPRKEGPPISSHGQDSFEPWFLKTSSPSPCLGLRRRLENSITADISPFFLIKTDLKLGRPLTTSNSKETAAVFE